MRRRILFVARISLALILVAAAGLLVWDYIVVHPIGHGLQFRVDERSMHGGSTVYVGQPDVETSFNADEGFAWEVRPVKITSAQAVIDFRVRHFNQYLSNDAMRAELQPVQFQRLTIHSEEKIRIAAPDGSAVSISGSIL